ncbi:transglycosylase SLT domain-containing protein [Burkholderia plantarii]|uniref:lytic transglycosylase domain-containing protein n=1 Tax=Burkholderia plantarii TaxID=41899 RepID=UPI0009F26C9A|nr:transglycosylase SLT domain-containing protein [Burkholderia plantarii]
MAMRYRKIALRGVAPLCLGALAAIALGCPGVARADCIDEAAAFQHVHVGLMRAIAQVESGTRTNVINPNSNGTFDIGLMQINSSWLPRLAREGITEQSLFDPCTNAYVGAWILSENIRQFGPTWNAIGAYNASAPEKRLAYARKVVDAARSIVSTADSPMPILPPSFTPPQTYNPFASLEVNQVKLAAPRAANAPGGLPAAVPAGAPPSPMISAAAPGQYNFGWDISGAPDVKPVQVFDDGTKIYAQFSDMKRVPAIFADTPHGRAVLRWESQPPYAVIASLEPSLVFQLGGAEAKARRRPDNAPLPPGMRAAAAAAASAPRPRAAGPASTDALWYVSTPSTVPGPTKLPDVETPANAITNAATNAATYATAQTAPAPAATPAAPAPATKPAADARNSTSALWYLTK